MSLTRLNLLANGVISNYGHCTTMKLQLQRAEQPAVKSQGSILHRWDHASRSNAGHVLEVG